MNKSRFAVFFAFLAAALRCYQGVISAESGHIAVHETGSVEACGHKVIALPHVNGKINAAQVSEYAESSGRSYA